MSESLMCPAGDNCENDTAVNLLRFIFDENWINSFITGSQNPALVKTTTNPDVLMPVLVNQVSSIAMMIALIILCVYLVFMFLSSTNDGEIKGVSRGSGSFLGSYGRPLFSLALLLPTPSGYPLIGVLIMALVLNSNGMANKAYEKYAERSLKTSSLMSFEDNPAFLASNSMLDAAYFGAMHGYCAKSAHQFMSTGVTAKVVKSSDSVRLILEDNNGKGKGNSGVSGEFCGSFTANLPDSSILSDDGSKYDDDYKNLIGTSKDDIKKIGGQIQIYRSATAFAVYEAAYQMTAGAEVYSYAKSGFDEIREHLQERIATTIYAGALENITDATQSARGREPNTGWHIVFDKK